MFTVQQSVIKCYLQVGVTEHTAPSFLQGTGYVMYGTPCLNSFSLFEDGKCWLSLPLTEGTNLLTYKLGALE